LVKSPSTLSYAVAPGSTNGVADLHSNVTGFSSGLLSVITGGESSTSTVLSAVEILF
jgi:hypothetical protein